jgi:hypothetical protein
MVKKRDKLTALKHKTNNLTTFTKPKKILIFTFSNSKMLKDLLKEGGLYTIANLLTKGVSLMLIVKRE